jgi:HNH endonuclease
MLFLETQPSLDSYWRSIILFGDNSTTYKFALGTALLAIPPSISSVSLIDLAEPFALSIAAHLKRVDRQGTSPSNSFLSSVRAFNERNLSKQRLLEDTVSKGFTYVLDRFHNVNRGALTTRFYDADRNRSTLVLTDNLLRLREEFQGRNLPAETEARWRLVETAWNLRVPSRTLKVEFDNVSEQLFIDATESRRISLTGCRDALNGYQKGRCFYCFREIAIEGPEFNTDIDHFFPWMLCAANPALAAQLNAVWNLVLACRACNRGIGGKGARVPALTLLQRLHRRNSYLIDSHHPLRETLIGQTGDSEPQRVAFLQHMDRRAIEIVIHRWSPTDVREAVF